MSCRWDDGKLFEPGPGSCQSDDGKLFEPGPVRQWDDDVLLEPGPKSCQCDDCKFFEPGPVCQWDDGKLLEPRPMSCQLHEDVPGMSRSGNGVFCDYNTKRSQMTRCAYDEEKDLSPDIVAFGECYSCFNAAIPGNGSC